MKNNTPEIRFNGFDKEWEQREFGTITSSYSGGTPTAGKPEFYDGDIPFIRSGEINEEKTELFLSELGFNSSSAAMVEKGDILYALYGATSGEVSISKLKGAINQAILAIKPNEDYDSEFIMQWLKNQKQNIISTYLQGGQGNLSGTIVKSLKIDVTTYAEQLKIGLYFHNLDSLITFHQQEYEKLVNTKKSMLDKMFPRAGCDVPEIRFKGFTEPWEQRKVSDILSDVERPIVMLDDETYQLVTVKRRNEGIVSRGYFKGKDILVKNYYRIHEGDFLISKRQVIHGANGYVPKSLDNAVVSNEYMVAVSNEDISSAFWTLMSQRKEMYQMYLFSSYGVDVEKMVFNVDDWKKRNVIIPKIEEQAVIVSFFSKLDDLITLHQQELEKLKNIKASLLRKMFV